MGNTDNMLKRMITRGVFCIMCALSLFIYCDFDDDDDHHHDPNEFHSSLWQDERHKEYEVRLSSEILPVFNDAVLRNSASDGTGPNDFAADMW